MGFFRLRVLWSGCGVLVGVKDGQAVAVRGNPAHPTNQGKLCLKGIYQWKALHHPERAARPMVRRGTELREAGWPAVMEEVASRMRAALAEGGPDAVGIYHGGQLLLEEYYALHKLAKGFLGTPNINANTRLCMASAVAGYVRTFGSDGPPGCYEDLDTSHLVFLFGSNPAEMHPQLWRRILRNRQKNAAGLVVADPRLTLPARVADLHLKLRCGTNIPLLYGLLHVLISEGMTDQGYIQRFTDGFSDLAREAAQYPPERVAGLTGVPAGQVVEAARLFGTSPTAVTLFCQGINQSVQATDAVTLINALHLVTGKVGRPGCAPFSLTGQASSLSMREVGGGPGTPSA